MRQPPQGAPGDRAHHQQQSALLDQQGGGHGASGRQRLGPASPRWCGGLPASQQPERQASGGGQGEIEGVIHPWMGQGWGQHHQGGAEQAEARPQQLTPPAGDHHQQQGVPHRQGPAGLVGAVTSEGHHRAVHQRGERRNLGGEIEQGRPAAPAAGVDQSQRAAVVEGAVEVVGLIPAGETLIDGEPEAVACAGQGPKPHQAEPPDRLLEPSVQRGSARGAGREIQHRRAAVSSVARRGPAEAHAAEALKTAGAPMSWRVRSVFCHT